MFDDDVKHIMHTTGAKNETAGSLSELWFKAIWQISYLTDSNLSKIPHEAYKWDMYGFPIASASRNVYKKREIIH